MAARTSCLLGELALPIIKYVVAPLEAGPEFALNYQLLGGWVNERPVVTLFK